MGPAAYRLGCQWWLRPYSVKRPWASYFAKLMASYIKRGALPTQHHVILGLFLLDPVAYSFLVSQSIEQGRRQREKRRM